MSRDRVLDLGELPLVPTVAHGGEGRILFCRALEAASFRGPWNFVDYAVLPPGTSIGRHTHHGNEELYVVLEGRGCMHVDGRDHAVGPGALILNRDGGTHGLRNDSTADLKILVIEVSCDGRRTSASS